MLVFANAKVFGGGFQIAPEADLADGRLDAVAFANMPLRRPAPDHGASCCAARTAATPAVDGRARPVASACGSTRPPAYETDGEWNRARSAELRGRDRPRGPARAGARGAPTLVPAPARGSTRASSAA